jgi:hypothetical protein
MNKSKLLDTCRDIYQEIKVNSWTEAKVLFDEIDQHFIFRGQSNAEWLLRTSIERCSFFAKSYHVEKDFVKDFQRGAFTYATNISLPKDDDYLNWLSLMQHHGAPTRFLDFSFSPFIAAFFALENTERNCAVWAIEKDHLKEDLHHKFKDGFQFHEDLFFDLKEEVFNRIFNENKISCVFPVRPFVTNKRSIQQQSIFVSLGNSNETFMEQLKKYNWPEYLKDHVIKIVLPNRIKDEALYDLNRMNINRSTLFSDLDGYSAYLKKYYELRHNGAQHKITASAEKRRNNKHSRIKRD